MHNEADEKEEGSKATRTRRAKVFQLCKSESLLAPAPERITMRTVRGKLLLGCSGFSQEKQNSLLTD
jgi:hypothetical protein